MNSAGNGKESTQENLWDLIEKELRTRNVASALFLLKKLAQDRDIRAYHVIGSLLEEGENGIRRDTEEAALWYRRAIFEADDPDAHLGLARMYWNGAFGTREFEKAKPHLERAYAAGRAEAALKLGILYQHGIGVEVDVKAANAYFEVAAEAGFVAAMAVLGHTYMKDGKPFAGLLLALKAFLIAIWLKIRNPDDRRLLFIGGRPKVNGVTD